MNKLVGKQAQFFSQSTGQNPLLTPPCSVGRTAKRSRQKMLCPRKSLVGRAGLCYLLGDSRVWAVPGRRLDTGPIPAVAKATLS